MAPSYELVLLTVERDLPVLAIGLPYLRRFLGATRITFVASRQCLGWIPRPGAFAVP